MNKEELINELAAYTGYTKKDCQFFLDAFCDIVGAAMGRGERIKIVNFGSFVVKKSKERAGKNFADNSVHVIPARNVPAFIPGERLKKIVGGASHDGR